MRLNPRVKDLIKQELIKFMYTPYRYKMDKRLEEIIHANTTAAGYDHYSFSYKGTFYNIESTVPRFKTNRLLPQYHPAIDEWLQEKQDVDYTERPFIEGFIIRVLNRSQSIDDYKRMLPDCTHSALDQFYSPEWLPHHLPCTMTDEEVAEFIGQNQDWILKLKIRMVIDLIT